MWAFTQSMTSTFNPRGPPACAAQRFKFDEHINTAAHQMAMRRTVIALSDFQSVFVAKTRFGRHRILLYRKNVYSDV